MSLFHPLSLTVNRYALGSYVNGRWVQGSLQNTFSIYASWQPANGDEMQTLPEGRRNSVAYKGYTITQLYTADQKQNTDIDFIVGPDSQEYEVIQVESWNNGLIDHYKFMAVREKEKV